MRLIKKMYDPIFVRFLLALFGMNGPLRKHRRDFTPYFQFKIGSYTADYYLYFPRAPYYNVYMIELIRKFSEYYAYGLVQFLDFHYEQFPDKKEFLRFLRYEMTIRLKWKTPKSKSSVYWQTLETCLVWVDEQEALLETQGRPGSAVPAPASSAPASSAPALSAPASSEQEHIDDEFTPSPNGKLTLNNRLHRVKLMQVFILLKDLNGPGKTPLPLFNSFSAVDVATMLQTLPEYQDKKLNTIQKAVTDAYKRLDIGDANTKKLIEALTDFFYNAS
jgi:hypothetical protein